MKTHAELVEMAAIWLRRKLPVVATDVVSGACETPDAIGFGSMGNVTLIEAKASRADFLKDRKKPFRHFPQQGMGIERYYLCNKGIAKPDELPDGWGLLEANGKRIMHIVASEIFHEHNVRAEQSLLISLLRRVGHSAPDGVSINCYTIENKKGRTTLGIEELS